MSRALWFVYRARDTPLHENAFHMIGHACVSEPPVIVRFHTRSASNSELWCCFIVNPNKSLNEQSSFWWFGMPWNPCHGSTMMLIGTIIRWNFNPVVLTQFFCCQFRTFKYEWSPELSGKIRLILFLLIPWGPFLLTWVNFNHSIDKKLHPLWSVGRNYLSLPNRQRCSHWNLETDK